MAQASKKRKIFDGRYEIISIVGRGSASVVYRAMHISEPKTEIALKVLVNKKEGASSSDRLRREALAMVSSRHKYVIRLDDFHSVDKICYLAMEYAPESDLRAFTKKNGGKLSSNQVEKFMLQLAEALSFIHQAGIVHRDIKPDNILVMNARQVRLGDFGVALLPGEETSLDELRKGIGTLDYMAPEVFKGEPYTRQSDVYLFGVTFYEILSGQHPFGKVPMAKVLDVRKDEELPYLLEKAPHVSPPLAEIVMKAMAFNPEDRFASGKELFHALKEIEGIEKKPSKPPSKPAATKPSQQKEAVKKEEPTKAKKKPRKRVRKKSKTQAERKKPSESQPQPFEGSQASSLETETKASTKKKRRRRRKRKKTGTPIETKQQAISEKASASPEAILKPKPTKEKPLDLSRKTNTDVETRTQAKKPLKDQIRIDQAEPATKPPQGSTTTVAAPYQISSEAKEERVLSEEKPVEIAETVEPMPEPEPFQPTPVEKETNTDTYDKYVPEAEVKDVFEYSPDLKQDTPKPSSPRPASSNKSYEKIRTPRTSQHPILSWILVLMVAIGAAYFLFGTNSSDSGSASNSSGLLGAFIDGDQFIPPVTEAVTSFPDLPAGIYTGVLSGFIPKIAIPFSVISIPEHSELVIIIGIEGWKPQTVSTKTAKEGVVRVKGQGYMFNLSGTVKDDRIHGTFQNLISEETGRWRLQAIK